MKLFCYGLMYVFSVIMERVVLKTSLGLWRCGCLAMLMTGVILVAKPDKLFHSSHHEVESNISLKQYYIGVGLALTAALCGAIMGITTKMLQGK